MTPMSMARAQSRPDRYGTRVVHQDANVRVVAFALLPGQEVPAHRSGSTVVVQVVEGKGVFLGDEQQVTLGPGGSVVFAPDETHSIRALDEGVHFLAVLAPAPH